MSAGRYLPTTFFDVGVALWQSLGDFHADSVAVKGYDLVTGLGSLVMNKLLPTLVAQP